MATTQFNVRISLELIEKLRESADRFGMKSGNEVAAEIIDRYFEFWLATKEAQQTLYDQQRANLSAEKETKPPSTKTPNRSRRK